MSTGVVGLRAREPAEAGALAIAEEISDAIEPPEARGLRREDVRLLVARGDGRIAHSRFRRVTEWLAPGDLLVVNTSATLPAALGATDDRGRRVIIHLSTRLPGDLWLVELRRPVDGAAPEPWDGAAVRSLALPGGARTELLAPWAPGEARLWYASIAVPQPFLPWLHRHGHPIRYAYVRHEWPLSAYQTVFAVEPGSAEMPSAARPFSPELVTELVAHGIDIAPLVLHTGVSSGEAHESPYPERFTVPAATARRVNACRNGGGRVVAVGTTVVRALETVVDEHGTVHPGEGWTEVFVTPRSGVRAVDGLITGWHDPRASHLQLLEAVAGGELVARSYEAAAMSGYHGHEFGDSHLLLP